jgi:hypothetical protein
MPSINTVANTDTFAQWIALTNQAISELNVNVPKKGEVLTGNLTTNGVHTIANLVVNTAATLNGSLTVAANTLFTSPNTIIQSANLAISSNVVVTGANVDFTGFVRSTGAVVLGSTLTVNGAIAGANSLAVTGPATFNANVVVGGALYFGELNTISPGALSANTNDWAPAGVGNASIIRMDASANVQLTGISAHLSGLNRVLYLINQSTARTITLPHLSASSTAGNRFICPNSASYDILPNQGVQLWYDRISTAWRVIATLTNNVTANNITVAANGTFDKITVTTEAGIHGAARFTSSEGTVFGTTTQDGYLSTPKNLYINFDSDNNDGSGLLRIAKGRTKDSGGTTLLSVNASVIAANTPITGSNATFSGTVTAGTFNGNLAWSNVTSKPSLVINDGGTYNINITGTSSGASVSWGAITGKPSLVENNGGTYSISISGTAAAVPWGGVSGAPNFLVSGTNIVTGSITASSIYCDAGGGTFNGHVSCESIAVSGSKSFKIPHPVREGFDLVHAAVEGPTVDLLYRGQVWVHDFAFVNIDAAAGMAAGTFERIARNPQVFLSIADGPWHVVRGHVAGAGLSIDALALTEDKGCMVNWMVLAERMDPSIVASDMTDASGRLLVEVPQNPQ